VFKGKIVCLDIFLFNEWVMNAEGVVENVPKLRTAGSLGVVVWYKKCL
jgi:hypothetical protein